MEDKTVLLNPGAGVSVCGGGLAADDGHRTFVVGGAYRQPWNRSARIAIPSRILQMAFSLMLGSVPIAFAQLNPGHTNGMQFASASQCATVRVFTIPHRALRLDPVPKSDPTPALSHLMPSSQEGGVAELNQPGFTCRANLADPALNASPKGWQIGGTGVLNYTARNQRWRFVVGYAPDIGALRETFDDFYSFNVAWQYSLGKHKPAGWTGVKAGSEYIRRPAPR